jgi:hypothetical protein
MPQLIVFKVVSLNYLTNLFAVLLIWISLGIIYTSRKADKKKPPVWVVSLIGVP